jgi:hypothetical protein
MIFFENIDPTKGLLRAYCMTGINLSFGFFLIDAILDGS